MVETSVEQVATKLRGHGYTVKTSYTDAGLYRVHISRSNKTVSREFAADASDLEIAHRTLDAVGELLSNELSEIFPGAMATPPERTTASESSPAPALSTPAGTGEQSPLPATGPQAVDTPTTNQQLASPAVTP